MAAEISTSASPLDCLCTGSVHRALAQSSGKVGMVLNVFERTVNVRTVQDELLVITLDNTRSPANMNVISGHGQATRFAGHAWEGQGVVLNKAGERTVLQVGDVAVSIGAPSIFENSLKEPVAGFLHTFAAEVGGILSVIGAMAEKRQGCLFNPDMTTEGMLGSFLNLLEVPNKRLDQHALRKALAGLCGRGPGFTPAGDDFIAGYLAAYNWLGRALRQWPSIVPGLEFSRLTTWTSFKLMEYSAKGLLDEHAQSMLNSVAAGNVADCIRRIEIVSRRGHTSGIDFASGVVVALCVMSDSLFGMDSLKSISSIAARRPSQLS